MLNGGIMKILLVFIFFTNTVIADSNAYTILNKIRVKLNTVLSFVEQKYSEFNFDGLLGVILAQAHLMKSLDQPLDDENEKVVTYLITKCQYIYNRILPLLSNTPKYMITFRINLLNVTKWKNMLSNDFDLQEIEYLGYYTNWSSETILNNKEALYNGLKSDDCLIEILELSVPNGPCRISKPCREMMLDKTRVDTGYLLTHRLLYIQIIRLHDCKIVGDEFWKISDYPKRFCSYIYKEAKTNEHLGFPYHDIFLEQGPGAGPDVQREMGGTAVTEVDYATSRRDNKSPERRDVSVALCGMEGFAEFLNLKWVMEIMEWQNYHGCYESIKQNLKKRTSAVIDFGCSDHSTGLGAAVLALQLRYLLYERQYLSHFELEK